MAYRISGGVRRTFPKELNGELRDGDGLDQEMCVFIGGSMSRFESTFAHYVPLPVYPMLHMEWQCGSLLSHKNYIIRHPRRIIGIIHSPAYCKRSTWCLLPRTTTARIGQDWSTDASGCWLLRRRFDYIRWVHPNRSILYYGPLHLESHGCLASTNWRQTPSLVVKAGEGIKINLSKECLLLGWLN